jgi:hypothetical protein
VVVLYEPIGMGQVAIGAALGAALVAILVAGDL